MNILTVVTTLCTSTAALLMAQTPSKPQRAQASVPGIPNKPDLVTVVPFHEDPRENAIQRTWIHILAEVDGRHGILVLDLGAPQLYLNRTFLRPSATGGLDTLLATDTTDTHQLPDWPGEDSVHVTLRLGTLTDTFVEPTMQGHNPRHINAFLNHHWDNFSGEVAPILGNMGLSVLEPFETIIDYTHRRVVLIRLDKDGHRLAAVPGYTPTWSAPLIDLPLTGDNVGAPPKFEGQHYWAVAVRLGEVSDTLFFDSGAPVNSLKQALHDKVATHLVNDTLDHMVVAGRTVDAIPFEDHGPNCLGYPFLSRFGVVGFNHRTHQFILYR